MSANTIAFSLTKIVVSDLDGLAEFYTRIFSLPVVHRAKASMAGRAFDEIIMGPTHEGGSMLVLQRFEDGARVTTGESLLGFVVGDAVSLLVGIEAAGGKIVQGLEQVAGQPVKLAFALDPEGHVIELVEYMTA